MLCLCNTSFLKDFYGIYQHNVILWMNSGRWKLVEYYNFYWCKMQNRFSRREGNVINMKSLSMWQSDTRVFDQKTLSTNFFSSIIHLLIFFVNILMHFIYIGRRRFSFTSLPGLPILTNSTISSYPLLLFLSLQPLIFSFHNIFVHWNTRKKYPSASRQILKTSILNVFRRIFFHFTRRDHQISWKRDLLLFFFF